jgi:flagellar motor switch/type III secretory pathway protein FliN
MDKGLRVKKVDGMFMDPVTVPDDKITVIADALKYKAPEITSGAAKTPAKVELGPDDRVFNNIIFKYTDDTLKVIVDLDKGGTAQLKRLLGTDEAVTKADEQIANAPTSGESKITLRYDPKMTGNILQRAVPKKMFRSSTDLQFRYLPGKKLLVLDLTGIEQAQWEEIAQQLDVGKKGEVGKSGLTISDLRQMQAGQIIEEIYKYKERDDATETKESLDDVGIKMYADVMIIFDSIAEVSEASLKRGDKTVPTTSVSSLKDGTILNLVTSNNANNPVIVYKKKLYNVFDYQRFLAERDRAASSNSSLSGLKDKGYKGQSVTYRVKAEEEKI